jgi:hypothetical protein
VLVLFVLVEIVTVVVVFAGELVEATREVWVLGVYVAPHQTIATSRGTLAIAIELGDVREIATSEISGYCCKIVFLISVSGKKKIEFFGLMY